MRGEIDADFDALCSARAALNRFLTGHKGSVLCFKHSKRPWFRNLVSEPEGDAEYKHITTTASCIESLIDANATAEAVALATGFAKATLAPGAEWKSDGAADVFCRARGLPVILQHAPNEVLAQSKSVIEAHMKVLWDDVAAEAGREAVREREPVVPLAAAVNGAVQPAPDQPVTPPGVDDSATAPGYPPNSFHTYWAVRCAQMFTRRFKTDPPVDGLRSKRELVRIWTDRVIGIQVSLQACGSEGFDANQLAWALATKLALAGERRDDQPYRWDRETTGLITAALRSFFSAQRESGTWPRYEPLFHFPRAGNAYCYTFETLCELLRPALAHDAVEYRRVLRPHAPELLKAWHHARDTALELRGRAGVLVWSSLHHPHRRSGEGWATAMVLSYLQCLRRVVGIWARETSAEVLGVRQPQWQERDEALGKLNERGNTWVPGGGWSVREKLAALFVHPISASVDDPDPIDPDRPLLVDKPHIARSAILFGPPGTGKTTLAEALAGAIGWKFVEVHASDFVLEGMEGVPRRADLIFRMLMELDRCVVLFDEIDEMLRTREGDSGASPFSRFLTTSMLPKMARLWEQRRVVFFVATNHLEETDPAIKRSQRFDALLFVPPPAFDTKVAELAKAKPSVVIADTVLSVETVETGLKTKRNEAGFGLGYFALLRFDQMRELADDLLRTRKAQDLSAAEVEAALKKVGGTLEEPVTGKEEGHEPENLHKRFLDDRATERWDHRATRLVWLSEAVSDAPDGWRLYPDDAAESQYLSFTADGVPPRSLETTTWSAKGDALLRFTVVRKSAGAS